MHIGGIFCALAMAFSCLNHEILLSTLQHCGIEGVNINWSDCTYSTGCKGWSQKFKVLKLQLGNCTTWVPQGSVLEPLLIIIYIIWNIGWCWI